MQTIWIGSNLSLTQTNKENVTIMSLRMIYLSDIILSFYVDCLSVLNYNRTSLYKNMCFYNNYYANKIEKVNNG